MGRKLFLASELASEILISPVLCLPIQVGMWGQISDHPSPPEKDFPPVSRELYSWILLDLW
ncbi:hypothetical protein ACLOJK_026422 [Asimina triloba]